jgi:hypothetical protein
MVKLTVRAELPTAMAAFTMATGMQACDMGKANTHIVMALFTLVTGMNTASNGLVEVSTMVSCTRASSC